MVLPLLLLTFSSIIITHSRVAEARLTTKILFPPDEDYDSPDLDISVQPPLPDFILHPKLPHADILENIPLPDLQFPEIPFTEAANKAVKKTP